MNGIHESGHSLTVPFAGLPLPKGFDVCWAGAFSVPFPPAPILCFGSVDGELLFSTQDLSLPPEWKPLHVSASGEGINGVAQLGTWVAVSTRQEVNFFATDSQARACIPVGAHGLTATPSGYLIAPLGRNGILTVQPPFGGASMPMVHTPDENVYIYRAITLRSQSNEEVVACAGRVGGVVTATFSVSREAQAMSTVLFKGIDVVDICPLCPESYSLAMAALGRDGSLILFRDVLGDKKPKILKFQTIKGVAYRILTCRGDIYVLTSKALYILAHLGRRFVNGEQMEGTITPIMPLDMVAVDMNRAWARWLLVVLANEVRRFDVDLIHDSVPQGTDGGEIQGAPPIILTGEPEWAKLTPRTRPLSPPEAA